MVMLHLVNHVMFLHVVNHVMFFTSWCKVFDAIRDLDLEREAAGRRNITWKFMDRRVCLPTWKSLHGLGTLAHWGIVAFSSLDVAVLVWHAILPFYDLDRWSVLKLSYDLVVGLWGTGRFNKILTAVQCGYRSPPVDLRYLKLRKLDNSRNQEIVSDVVSFLQKVYSSTAETLPDVKDDTLDDTKYFISVQDADVEPYSNFDLNDPAKESETDPGKEKIAKPRKMRKSIQIQPGRSIADDNEERHLPPGTMQEYYVQYKAQTTLVKPASFPSFWRVSWLQPHQWFLATNFNFYFAYFQLVGSRIWMAVGENLWLGLCDSVNLDDKKWQQLKSQSHLFLGLGWILPLHEVPTVEFA